MRKNKIIHVIVHPLKKTAYYCNKNSIIVCILKPLVTKVLKAKTDHLYPATQVLQAGQVDPDPKADPDIPDRPDILVGKAIQDP